MSDIEIQHMETWLRSAGRAFAYPETPSLAGAVAARLREPEPHGLLDGLRERLATPALRFALAGVAAVLVVAGALLAVPQSRTALADFFGLGHVRIEFDDFDDLVGDEAPLLAPGSYARPMTLDDAAEIVDFPIVLPADGLRPMQPDEVFVQGWETTIPTVILVYEDEDVDLALTRFGFFGKGGPPEGFEEVQVGGREGIWIEEGGHVAWFIDERDRVVVESRRLVERATLFWEDPSGVTYRLETSLPKAEAIALAESVR